MTAYNALVKPWAHGWEIHIDGYGVTQARVLAKVEQQVRDYVETLTGTDTTGHEVRLRFDLDGLEKEISDARSMTAAAASMQAAAAEATRSVVAEIRRRGISVSDAADLLGVSRGRISQLSG